MGRVSVFFSDTIRVGNGNGDTATYGDVYVIPSFVPVDPNCYVTYLPDCPQKHSYFRRNTSSSYPYCTTRQGHTEEQKELIKKKKRRRSTKPQQYIPYILYIDQSITWGNT